MFRILHQLTLVTLFFRQSYQQISFDKRSFMIKFYCFACYVRKKLSLEGVVNYVVVRDSTRFHVFTI